MARVDVTRGLGELRRQLRKSRHALRNYNGDTLLFLKAGGGSYGTPAQQAAQELLRDASAAWNGLETDSKQAWKNYAARYGKLMGDQKYKDFSAWDVYHPANRNRMLLGLSPVEAPINAAPPEPPISVEEVPSADDRTFTFRIIHGLAAEGFALLARITPASISTSRKPVARDLRLICGHSAQSILPLPASGETVTFTNANFGVAAGGRYGVELRIARTADGVHSKALFLDLRRKDFTTTGNTERSENTNNEKPLLAKDPLAAQPPRTARALPPPLLGSCKSQNCRSSRRNISGSAESPRSLFCASG